MQRKENPCTLLVGMHVGAALMENSIRRLQKLKLDHSIQHSHPGYIFKGNEITVSKIYLYPYVHCSIIYDLPRCGNNLIVH